jgi:hypothetical protein
LKEILTLKKNKNDEIERKRIEKEVQQQAELRSLLASKFFAFGKPGDKGGAPGAKPTGLGFLANKK